MKKKTSNKYAWITVSVVLVLAVCVIIGYAFTTGFFSIQTNAPERSFSVYFLDATRSKPVVEQREIKVDENTDVLKELVDNILAGPKGKDNTRAIPKGTKLLGLEKNGTVLTLNFSEKYYGATAADDMLAAITIVKTLCDIEGVQKVRILVEGQELIGTAKKPLGALGKDDLVSESAKAAGEDVIVTLYFPLTGTDLLGAEKRKVTLKDKELVERSIINELIKGSDDKLRPRSIAAESKLLSVETKDRICFVNFSKEFIEKQIPGTSSAFVTIYSIVNSLTELENVSKVQFLIEGQKVEVFGEKVFNEPFERDESFIKK